MGRIQIEKRAGKGNPGRSKGWVPEKAGEEQRGLLRGQARVWLPASERRQLNGMESKWRKPRHSAYTHPDWTRPVCSGRLCAAGQERVPRGSLRDCLLPSSPVLLVQGTWRLITDCQGLKIGDSLDAMSCRRLPISPESQRYCSRLCRPENSGDRGARPGVNLPAFV